MKDDWFLYPASLWRWWWSACALFLLWSPLRNLIRKNDDEIRMRPEKARGENVELLSNRKRRIMQPALSSDRIDFADFERSASRSFLQLFILEGEYYILWNTSMRISIVGGNYLEQIIELNLIESMERAQPNNWRIRSEIVTSDYPE